MMRLREQDSAERLAAGWIKAGDDWIPPGWVPAGGRSVAEAVAEAERLAAADA